VRKKTIIFIVVILVLLIIGVFAGWKFVAAGGGLVGLVGATLAGISGKRKPVVDTVAEADKRASDAERENRAAVGSMDSVSSRSEDIRTTGEQLVNKGDGLVESSKNLIDELRERDANANKGT